jgi:hypothetical protein
MDLNIIMQYYVFLALDYYSDGLKWVKTYCVKLYVFLALEYYSSDALKWV